MVEERKQGVYTYKFIDNMKESTGMIKFIWRNDVQIIIGKMTDMWESECKEFELLPLDMLLIL